MACPPRDFLDLDAIRRSGRFTDPELYVLASERDGGVEPGMFARQLDRVRRIPAEAVEQYGVGRAEWAGVQARCIAWAVDIATASGVSQPRVESGPLAMPPNESGPGPSL